MMNTVRAFIAVEIDSQARQKISELISDLKKSNADAKWITENQMHLTLKFLGNIEEARIQPISDTLKLIADNFNQFSITLSKIGVFPNMRNPRVIWIGIEKGIEDLKILNIKIEDGLEKLGFAKENRDYKGHLTLGRVRSQKNISNLSDLIKKTDFSSSNEIKINELILFQSTLTPKGAIYIPISRFNLARAAKLT